MAPCGPTNTLTCCGSWTGEGRHALQRHQARWSRAIPSGGTILKGCPMFGPLITWFENLVTGFNQWWPADSFFFFEMNVYSALAVFLVALICGAVGSLVVANRMAFFSDALAHCSFAGAACG